MMMMPFSWQGPLAAAAAAAATAAGPPSSGQSPGRPERQHLAGHVVAYRRELLDHFPKVVADLGEVCAELGIPEGKGWLTRVIEYNAPHGKLVRSCLALHACREMAPHYSPGVQLTVAWASEMLHAAFAIADDVVDGSASRRGRAAWHALPDVNTSNAVVDGGLLEASIHQMLRRHLREGDGGPAACYLDVVDLFKKVAFSTALGNTLDLYHAFGGAATTQWDTFGVNRYRKAAIFKTSLYSVYAPVASAMYMAGISDPRKHEIVWDILADVGVLLQVQNDFTDLYGADRSKFGEDIPSNKCTWFIVEAKQRASDRQLAALKANYGKTSEPGSARVVQQVYEELGLRDAALQYEREAWQAVERRALRQNAVPASVLLLTRELIPPFAKDASS